MQKRTLIGSALTAIVLSYCAFLALDPITTPGVIGEDALIENLGAAFSLLAASLFLVCFFWSAGKTNRFLGIETKRNLWFLALSALMFVCFGEEISWGQRVFGWEAPLALRELNV